MLYSTNPTIDIGQITGAFIMGQGYFLQEEMKYDSMTGELINNSTSVSVAHILFALHLQVKPISFNWNAQFLFPLVISTIILDSFHVVCFI